MQRGKNIGSRVEMKNGQTSVGRNPDNDVVLDEPAVSRYHAVFRFDESSGDATIMDLGSTNGVTVNNVEIKSGTPYKLQQRDTIFVGRAVFNIQFRSDQHEDKAIPARASDSNQTGHLVLPRRYRDQTKPLG